MEAQLSCSTVKGSTEVPAQWFVARLSPVSGARSMYLFQPVCSLLAPSTTPVSEWKEKEMKWRRFVSQDFTPGETHPVLLSQQKKTSSEGGPDGVFSCSDELCVAFDTYHAPPSAPFAESHLLPLHVHAALLTFYCPLVMHPAKTITLTGKRFHSRLSLSHLHSCLMGQYVLVGATARIGNLRKEGSTELGELYGVVDVETKQRSGYRGVVLVAAQCKMRLNDQHERSTAFRNDTSSFIIPSALAADSAISAAIQECQRFLSMAAACEEWTEQAPGLLVRGPRGCWVSRVVRYCLDHPFPEKEGLIKFNSSQMALECVVWEPGRFRLAYVLEHVVPKARLLVLLIPEAAKLFPSEEEDLAKMALRSLEKDTEALRNASQVGGLAHDALRVAVVSIAHDYATSCAGAVLETFFHTQIVLQLPDADQRAALLAESVGSSMGLKMGPCTVDPSTKKAWEEHWLRVGLTLVGYSREKVVEVGSLWSGAMKREWARTTMNQEERNWSTVVERLQYLTVSHPSMAALSRVVTWDEIGGLLEVKQELQSALVLPQKHRAAFNRFNLTPPSGVLLYGPPGCAKTTLVKALCSEGIFSLIYLDSATVMSAYVGESERMLRDVFHRAAQQAPCIIFFDEVEVLGRTREKGSDSSGQKDARLLSTVLTEMDGFASNGASTGVCFVGATNAPHLLDPGLLRPGRLDRLLYVGLPNVEERMSILTLYLRSTAADLSLLAQQTEGFSGADLKAFCGEALVDLLTEESCKQQSATDRMVYSDGDSTQGFEACFQDADLLNAYLARRVQSFPRTSYDTAALKKFHEMVTRAK